VTEENPEKPKPESAKTVELAARVRNAAALKYSRNLTDAELAEHFNVSVHTIADWKKRKQWTETVKHIASEQLYGTYNEILAMAPVAREALFELLQDESPAIRLKVAKMICDWALTELPFK
jgi:transcriptional regulator with XRE-family HTH domain